MLITCFVARPVLGGPVSFLISHGPVITHLYLPQHLHRHCLAKKGCKVGKVMFNLHPSPAHLNGRLLSCFFFTACPHGWYGANCQQLCVCHGQATCDSVTGECRCPQGWMGIACELGESLCILQCLVSVFLHRHSVWWGLILDRPEKREEGIGMGSQGGG